MIFGGLEFVVAGKLIAAHAAAAGGAHALPTTAVVAAHHPLSTAELMAVHHIANSVATNPAIPHAAKVAFAQAIQALTGAPGTAAVSASSTAPVGVGHWHALAHLIRMSEPYQEAKDAAKNAPSDFLKDLVSDRRGDWESVLGRIRQQSA